MNSRFPHPPEVESIYLRRKAAYSTVFKKLNPSLIERLMTLVKKPRDINLDMGVNTTIDMDTPFRSVKTQR